MRVLARIFIVLIAIVLLLGPALYLGRDGLAPIAVSWFARVGLGIGDLGGLDFRISELRGNALTLKSLTAGDSVVSADTVEVTYEYAGLRGGRIKSLTITGLTLRGDFKDGVLDLGPLNALLHAQRQDSTSNGSDRLPLDILALNATRVILGTPWGVVNLTGDISARQAIDGTLSLAGALRGRLTNDASAGESIARFDIGIDGGRGPEGTVTGTLLLSRGKTGFENFVAASVSGSVAFQVAPGELATARASLRLGGLRAYQGEASEVVLDALVRGDSGSVTATIGSPKTPDRHFTLAAAVKDGGGPRIKLSVNGTGSVEPLFRSAGGDGNFPFGEPRGELDFQGSVMLPGPLSSLLSAPGNALTGAVGTGTADLSISSLRYQGRVHDGDLKARMAAIVAPGLVELRAADVWRVNMPASLSRSLAAMAPAEVRHWFDSGLTAELGRDGAAPSMLIDFTGERAKALISGTLGGGLGPERRVDLGGAVNVQFPRLGQADGWWADLEDVTLRLSDFGIGEFQLGRCEAFFDGHVTPNETAGNFRLNGDLAVSSAEISGEAGVRFSGRIAGRSLETRVFLDGVEIRADELNHLASATSIMSPVLVSQTSGTTTEITLSGDPAGHLVREVKTALEIGLVTLGLAGDGSSRTLKIQPGQIAGHFKDNGEPSEGSLHLAMSEVAIDDGNLPIVLSGASAKAKFQHGEAGPRLRSFDFDVAEITNMSQPAWFFPFQVRLSGSSGDSGETLPFQGSIASLARTIDLPFSGILRPEDGSGHIVLAKTALSFNPGGLTVLDVSPALGEHIKTLEGRILLAGHLNWPDTTARDAQRFSAELENLTIRGREFAIENTQAYMTFINFAPLRTDGVRSVAMESIEGGVTIVRPRVDLSVDGLDHIKLHRVSGGFAGGALSARDIDFSTDRPTRVMIQVSGVSATDLSNLANVEGLYAEGTLSGVVPVTWTPGIGLSVTEAKLTADSPGKVRYLAGGREEALRDSGEQVGLMLDALSDFRFKTLDLKLDGAPGDGYRIGLALEGANPNLYDGYPVRFNLDLSGQLDDIIKTGYRTYTLPTRVRDAVLRSEANE